MTSYIVQATGLSENRHVRFRESATFRSLLERVVQLCMSGNPGTAAADKLMATRGMSILAVHLAAMPGPGVYGQHGTFGVQVPCPLNLLAKLLLLVIRLIN